MLAQTTPDNTPTPAHLPSNASIGDTPNYLANIYHEPVNLAVFERDLDSLVVQYIHLLVTNRPSLNLRAAISPENSELALFELLPDLADQESKKAFVKDLSLLIDMYSCLFELEEVGMRLQALDRAMCPKFHTDKLGCRLVSTYLGKGTEWLSDHDIDRTKLGRGSNGKEDSESGLYLNDQSIHQVSTGDVVLLKGDGWFNNEGKGAVHRSPFVEPGDKRIVLTLDFA